MIKRLNVANGDSNGYRNRLIMSHLVLLLCFVLAQCAKTTGAPAVGGGGSNAGNGASPSSDASLDLGDGSVTGTPVCLDLSAQSTSNQITVTASGLFIDFNLSKVEARWDCNTSTPRAMLVFSNGDCQDGSAETQKLTLNIPSFPQNSDSALIATSASYTSSDTLNNGVCGFDDGSFVFQSGGSSGSRITASNFSLTNILADCSDQLAGQEIIITGQFDIDLGTSYSEACP